ncbi:MAG: hypothetical protein KZQ83_12570 [gamma proteobacterium symbiont of Taylorina sp.]|nr:hypothetical protein [gamma proteobacterium symbiont of Taylorina sp.]
MSKIREMIINAEKHEQEKQKEFNIAKVLISFAIYLIAAGTLMDYVSIPVMLKTIGFMLTGHAFFFLWKSSIKES